MILRSLLFIVVLMAGPIQAHGQAVSQAKGTPIVIDGRMDDWDGAPILARAAGQGRAVDLAALSLTHDPEFLFVQVAVHRPVNLLALPEGTLSLLVDSIHPDADESSGPSPRLAIDYSPPRSDTWNGPRYGARIRHGPGHQGEDVLAWGILSAPTHSARQWEIAIPRWVLSERVGDGAIRVTVAHRDNDGETTHTLAPVDYTLDPADTRPQPRATVAVDPPRDPTAVRVFALNVADQQFLRRGPKLAAQLRALEPDVLLFDEVPDAVTPDHVRGVLAIAFGDSASNWALVIGRSGGRQRGVIATHWPIEPLEPFFPIRYSKATVNYVRQNGTRRMTGDLARMDVEGMPAAGAAVEVAGRVLHFVTFDLQCCGFDGSPEDRFRVLQAETLHGALGRSGRADGVVLAGDANLVGSDRPLHRLRQPHAPDGAPLAIVPAPRLTGRSLATYGFRGPFPEGQLDFMLYSPSQLEVVNAFVFDTAELPQDWLARHGLEADTTAWVSDHRPIVADFRIRSTPTRLEAGPP